MAWSQDIAINTLWYSSSSDETPTTTNNIIPVDGDNFAVNGAVAVNTADGTMWVRTFGNWTEISSTEESTGGDIQGVDITGGAGVTVSQANTESGNYTATLSITDAEVTFAKMQDVAANSILGRNADSSGVLSEIALTDTKILIGDGTGFTAAALSGDVTMLNTGAVTIGNSKVTLAKMANLAGMRVIGRGNLATGVPEAVTIFDENDMASDSAVALATQQSIKYYVDNTANAATVTVVDSTDTTSFVALFDSAVGTLPIKTDTGITYNSETGMLTATGFTGPLTGNADTATTATNVIAAVDTSSSSPQFIAFLDNSNTTAQQVLYDTGIQYTPSTKHLQTTTVTASDFLGNATTATSAATWTTTRTFSFSGDVTGSSTVNGGADVATVMDIANNVVGLAEMSHGVDGNLITFGADTAPAYVATGTAGQVLTSGGTGAAPTFTTLLVTLTGTQTLTNKTLTLPKINDTSSDHQYIFGVSELTANRTVTLPLLGDDDTFVFADFAQRLRNKTFTTPQIDDADVSDQYIIYGGALTQDVTVTIPTMGVTGSPDVALTATDFVLTGTTQTLVNKTITAPTINGGTINGITALSIVESGGGNEMQIGVTQNLTADRLLTINMNDAARTLNLAGNLVLNNNFTTSGNFALTITTTATTGVTLPTTGQLATLAGVETLSSKTLTLPKINDIIEDDQYIFAVSELDGNKTITLPQLLAHDTFVFENFIQRLTNKTFTTPQIDDTTRDNQYIFGVSELTENITVTLPLLTADDTFIFANFAQRLTNKTFTTPQIDDASGGTSNVYTIYGSELEENISITLPALDDDDIFVFAAFTQTLANKTLTTPIIGSFANAAHDHADDAGGGALGVITIAGGGTGETTAANAYTALSPTTALGDIIYRGASADTKLTKGNAAQVLTMGDSNIPTWANALAGGNVNSGTAAQVAYYATSTNAVSGQTFLLIYPPTTNPTVPAYIQAFANLDMQHYGIFFNQTTASGTDDNVFMKAPADVTTGGWNFVLPANAGTDLYVLKTDGTGNTEWVAPSSSGTVSNQSSDLNQVAFYNTTGTTVSPASVLRINTSSSQVEFFSKIYLNQVDLVFEEKGGGTENEPIHTITIQAPSVIAADYTLTLPVDDGGPNQHLMTNGSGVLSWTAAGTGTVATSTQNYFAYYSSAGTGTAIGGTNNLKMVSSDIVVLNHLLPNAENNSDLGSATKYWQDLFVIDVNATNIFQRSGDVGGSIDVNAALEFSSLGVLATTEEGAEAIVLERSNIGETGQADSSYIVLAGRSRKLVSGVNTDFHARWRMRTDVTNSDGTSNLHFTHWTGEVGASNPAYSTKFQIGDDGDLWTYGDVQSQKSGGGDLFNINDIYFTGTTPGLGSAGTEETDGLSPTRIYINRCGGK